MRLLHTSDWHIGRQLHGVSLIEDQRHVLEQIINIAETESVHAVIIAGDVYDRAVPPAEAVKLLGEMLNRLCLELKKHVILIAGNHDSGERLGFGSELMGSAGLHIIGPLVEEILPITLTKGKTKVDVFGLPYAGPLAVRQLLNEEISTHEEAMSALMSLVSNKRSNNRPTVVVAHCFVDGAQGCDSERPLSVGGAEKISASVFEDYTYAALGHLHGAQYQGHEHIRYSGSILKYSFSEVDHLKSVTLVDIDGEGAATTHQIALEPLRDMRIVEGALDEILKIGATDPRADDYILARITDKQAILDVMGKLRDVYPNVLQMQNIGLREANQTPEASREMLQKSYMNLFEDFFTDVQEAPLTEDQRAYMVKLLGTVDEGGEE